MKPPRFLITEAFRSETEAERSKNLQEAVDGYLLRALGRAAPSPAAPAGAPGAEREG